MTFSKIRYKYIHQIINDIYIQQNISSLPIDIINVINSIQDKKIKVISYSEFMKFYNLSVNEVYGALTSDDGCCDCLGDKYVIYYNDLIELPKKRIYWTITHELGHILCEHYNNRTRIFRNDLSDEEYNFMESEANYFASTFLAHPAILSQLEIHNSHELEIYCSLSKQAAEYRYSTLKRWTNYNYLTSSDRYIIRNFKEYIESKMGDFQEHLRFINSFYC